jgi:hypothetical protein
MTIRTANEESMLGSCHSAITGDAETAACGVTAHALHACVCMRGAVAASLDAAIACGAGDACVRLASLCITILLSLLVHLQLSAAPAAVSAGTAHNTHCLQVQPSQLFKACSTGAALVEMYLN